MLQEYCADWPSSQLFMKNKILFLLIITLGLLSLPLFTALKNGTVDFNLATDIPNLLNKAHILQASESQGKEGQVYLPFVSKGAYVYYVATNGKDSNPGTYDRPWRTIGKAAHEAFAGATIYIRGGVYHEVVEVRKSGTQKEPIRFLAYPGETPIIDGSNQIPTYWVGLFSMLGNWVEVSGLEVRNSRYDGFGLYGDHDTANQVYAHHCQYHGVMIKSDYGTVKNSRFWRNSLMNEYGISENGSSALYAASDFENGLAEHAQIINNVVWENWGEGISTSNADQVLISNNLAHDNYAANIYVTDSTNIRVENNFVYMNPASYVFGHGSNVGIMMGDEEYNPPSANITIINNIAYGNNRNFYWWRGVRGGGMVNVLIAHNSFVNSVGTSGVIIMPGAHQNVRFVNNLTEQDGNLPVIYLDDPTGITFSNNLWSKAPPPRYPSPLPSGDLIGDPLLVKAGEPFSPEWYVISSNSPVIGAAITVSGITKDYFENPRDAYPDIGGAEYINTP
jgi:parallel beta-helix repeat protein